MSAEIGLRPWRSAVAEARADAHRSTSPPTRPTADHGPRPGRGAGGSDRSGRDLRDRARRGPRCHAYDAIVVDPAVPGRDALDRARPRCAVGRAGPRAGAQPARRHDAGLRVRLGAAAAPLARWRWTTWFARLDLLRREGPGRAGTRPQDRSGPPRTAGKGFPAGGGASFLPRTRSSPRAESSGRSRAPSWPPCRPRATPAWRSRRLEPAMIDRHL